MQRVLRNVFEEEGGNLRPSRAQPRELTIAKVELFYGKDDKDPVEWLQNFNKAAATNNWATDKRKITIAASYLRDAAADWYKIIKDTINDRWENQFNNQ